VRLDRPHPHTHKPQSPHQRLLADAMREHFGDTAETPRLLFIPFAAADGDYDAYVKRTIELVRWRFD
jgi:hypothetical protein